MNKLPEYYLLLSEEEKKSYVATLMSKGCMQQWVTEEGKRMGLNFLSEFYKEEEERMLSESYKQEGK